MFYVDISASFPCGIPGYISTWKFALCFPKNFKMQYNSIGRVQVMWKYPSDDLMSFFSELKCLQVWGNFPLILTPIWKLPWISARILVSLTTQISTWIPSTNNQNLQGIPRRICEPLPAGNILLSLNSYSFSTLLGLLYIVFSPLFIYIYIMDKLSNCDHYATSFKIILVWFPFRVFFNVQRLPGSY
mgnify:CR=1 FL=1